MNIQRAEVELTCPDLVAALDTFATLGFRVEMIMPADDPELAVIEGHGVRLRLIRGPSTGGGIVRLACGDPTTIEGTVMAGGIRVELVPERRALEMPPLQPTFVLTRNDPDAWRLGRANMEYRDLIPDRQGGRFVASHIRIPDGGPVPDYVHFHAIRFQMIYCYRGWVRVVYEDQGEPFVMHPGDCVMQPPGIRHLVLECSPNLEVIEVSTPAVHETHADRELGLPTSTPNPSREFEGQRFAWHRASGAPFEAASLGIATASGGIASARVVNHAATPSCTHDAELMFGFVLRGELELTCAGQTQLAATGDAFTIPHSHPFELGAGSTDLALLEVTLPGRFQVRRHMARK